MHLIVNFKELKDGIEISVDQALSKLKNSQNVAWMPFDAPFEFLGKFPKRCIVKKDVLNFETNHKTC